MCIIAVIAQENRTASATRRSVYPSKMVAEQLAAMEGRLGQLEATVAQLRGDVADHARGLEAEKGNFQDQINLEFAKHKIVIQEIIASAKKEFDDVKTNLNTLCHATDAAIKEVTKKIDNIDGDKGGHGGWKAKGYIPTKSLVPKVFSNKEEDWRRWQDDAMDYFDSINPGMKELLKEIEVETVPVDDDWIKKAQHHDSKVREDQVQIWRALKNLTDGEGRKVVTSVRSENGYRAWQKLHMRFGPSLSSKQGLVLMELSGMVSKPAKNPAETRMLLTEMEQRIKVVEDITGEDVSENHAKSILVGILDPTTRQHTAMHHGSKTTCDELKKVVLEFINNVTRRDDNAMQVGRISLEEEEDAYIGDTCQNAEDGEEEYLGVVGGWQQCYKCQGYGHLARECPSKGKGKGEAQPSYGKAKGKGWSEGPKGKGKGAEFGKGAGKGKGKRRPLYGTCWTCGGDHFAAECPSKGKGKGGKGLNSFEEEWAGAAKVKSLSCLRQVVEVEPKVIPVERKDESSQAEQTKDFQGEEMWTLVDYRKIKPKQGDVKRERKDRARAQKPVADQRAVRQLKLFTTIEPEAVNAVQDNEWEEIELAVDSGASETVIGEDMLTSVATKEGPASRRGVQYEVANGVRIPNLGEKHFQGFTEEGMPRNLKAQVCDVNKALLSVSKLVQMGNKVVFDGEGSYIEDKPTGERLWLREQGGMYMLKLWVKCEGF